MKKSNINIFEKTFFNHNFRRKKQKKRDRQTTQKHNIKKLTKTKKEEKHKT